MKKTGRIALLFVGGILALLAIALLAVNLYVQSQGTQARIQAELSQRLGTTLLIRRISVTPWWGLKLTGITMPQTDPAISEDFLRADTFRLRIRVASLFSGRLVIKEISLVRPKVMWAQNAEGQWRLPASLPVDEAGSASGVDASSAVQDARPETPRLSEAATAPPARSDSGDAEAAPFTPEVRRVNLAHGSFHFLDVKGKPVATFDGVGFRSSRRNATELRGEANIAKISLRDRFFLQELKSPLKYDPRELEFSQITARAAGGEITGQFSIRPADADSPFTAKVGFRDVQVNRVMTEAGGPAGMLRGRIEGSLDARGKTADPNALAGAGEIYLRDGEVRQYPLLVALGQLLQLDELEQLRLDQAQVKYRITPGIVMIDELLLTSPNIRLSATGTVTFAGKLRLESELAINEKVRGQLFRAVRENFQPIEPPGYSAVNFQVTGTVGRPKTNLMGKLIGPELKDLGGIISGLLGGGKSDRPAKKKRAKEPAPSPAEQEASATAPAESPQPVPSP